MLKLEKLNKSFDSMHVLKDVDFEINKGEVISIIGPSGSGKSTLLKSINGLVKAESGNIHYDHISKSFKDLTKQDSRILRQNISMVFQNYNLFEHFTALENVYKPLVIVHGYKKEEAIKQTKEILDLVGLKDKYDAYPRELSGGQQQRVGIARAIVNKPDLVLLDEPTSALDPELVGEVLSVIKKLAEEKMTLIVVTHEINFALNVSDKILFMENGEVIVKQTPKEIKESTHPRLKTFIKQFEH